MSDALLPFQPSGYSKLFVGWLTDTRKCADNDMKFRIFRGSTKAFQCSAYVTESYLHVYPNATKFSGL